MSDMESRRQLLTSAQCHEQEMEQALGDLKRAVQRPFALREQVGARIGEHPLPWLAASALIGLWLGSRTK